MSNMRRGFHLENELNRVVAYLNSIGIHAHKNHPRRTEDGTWIEGEPFDYEVLSGGVLHCFDAKECKGRRWSLQNAKPGQLNNLLACRKNGANAFFLVLFTEERKLKRFDAELVRAAMSEGKKSLMLEEGADWDWTELSSSRNGTASWNMHSPS